MESEERHELKQNDLRTFLTNFGQWWQQYGNLVLIVVALVCLVLAGYFFYSTRQHQAHNAAWGDLATSTSPDALMNVAESHDRAAVRALAYLRAGDLYLDRAVQTTDNETTEEELLDAAATAYERVARSQGEPIYRANALLGLASVAENRGQWDQAQNRYEQVEELANQHHLSNLAEQAAARIDMLDRLSRPVRFTEGDAQPGGPGGMPQMPGGMPAPGGGPEAGAGGGAPQPGEEGEMVDIPLPEAPGETAEPAEGETDEPAEPGESDANQSTDPEGAGDSS